MIREHVVYGASRSQFVKVMVDPTHVGPIIPVVVLVHGGFWHTQYSLVLENAVARDLMLCGALVINVEYRRVGEHGGGWPGTGHDVVAALRALDGQIRDVLPADIAARADWDSVAVVGHSAGGHLATWAVAQLDGVTDTSRIATVVAQAAVLDLVEAGKVARRSVRELMGIDYERAHGRYLEASPVHQKPFNAHVVAIHGESDINVPAQMSVHYVERAKVAGQSAELILVPDEAHDAFLNPRSRSHRETLRALGLSHRMPDGRAVVDLPGKRAWPDTTALDEISPEVIPAHEQRSEFLREQ